MRRYKHCATILMAEGEPAPAWPLPDVRPRFATWSLCGGRPFSCDQDCKRWHAGIDLVGAGDRAMVVAPEDAVIVKLDVGWSEGSRAVFLRTKTGLFVVLGGTIAGSGAEWKRKAGDAVKKGEPVGRVKGSYGMIHLETYADDGSRTHNSRWYLGEPPPDGLRNPLNYVQRAAGVPATMETHEQRQQALFDLGYSPDPIGEAWGERSKEALKQAQTKLGVTSDGIWGPNTEAAIRRALDEKIEAEARKCGANEDTPCLPEEEHDAPEQEPENGTPEAHPATARTMKPMTVAIGLASAAAVIGGIALVVRAARQAPDPLEGVFAKP
ncbi:MAG: peptidoglycan-binding protein [Nannocystaceae bacterium]